MPLSRSVFWALDRSARRHGARAAIGVDGGTLTFADLHHRALQVADGLRRRGVEHGDRVAVMMDNRAEWVETFFALAALGAVCVPINVFLAAPELDHVLRDSGARVLIADAVAAEVLDRLAVRPGLLLTVGDVELPPGVAGLRYEEVTTARDDPPSPPGPDLDDPFVLYYTSGTTGRPKAAEHSHNGILWNAMAQWHELGLDQDVRCGVVSSLSWAAGFHVLVVALVWAGGFSHVRPLGGATPERIVDYLVGERITHTFLVPSLLHQIAGRPELLDALDRSDLTWVLTGSAPVPRPLLERFAAAVPDVALCQGYGFSEFPPIVCVLRPDETADHEGSAGRPLAVTSVAVRTPDDRIAPTGRGELLVRSLASMTGYHGRPDETGETFRDGWLHSGDLADVDDQGFVTIIGRTRELIISGGLNVYPKEVEEVIDTVAGVAECAVVGVPHEIYGETAVAVVVPSGPGLDPATVDAACRAALAAYKRPRHVLARREPLPRNVNAKITKGPLRDWVHEQLGLPAVPDTERT